MVEKWRKALNEGGETGTALTDLSKAFNCIDHNLLIAKLNGYGFERQSINFMCSYLTKRKHRTNIYIYIYIYMTILLDCMLLSCHVRISERIYTLSLPECQRTT